MNTQELDHKENLAVNRMTAKLIASNTDDFDCQIARQANALTYRVSQHRNINLKTAKIIVVDFIEVN